MPRARSYLEIGLSMGRTFEHVQLPRRVGVDPVPRFDLQRLPNAATVWPVTSDVFFAEHAPNDKPFDLVFLDGLHAYRQTYRDLIGALAVCPLGAILIDDVVPSDEVSAMMCQTESMAERQRRGLAGGQWHGDVYKVMLCLSDHHPEVRVRTIMGGGNPQAVVWRPDEMTTLKELDDADLRKFEGLTFEDVFSNGVPDYFFPCSEADAVVDALADVGSRYL